MTTLPDSPSQHPDPVVPRPEHADATQKYVAFKVANYTLAVDIAGVLEIRAWTNITPLPNTADHVLGVINLRGAIVPVLDLGQRFGLDGGAASEGCVFIIVEVARQRVGLLVDTVIDIIDVDLNALQGIPDLEASPMAEFLSGLIDHEGELYPVVALEQVVGNITTQPAETVEETPKASGAAPNEQFADVER